MRFDEATASGSCRVIRLAIFQQVMIDQISSSPSSHMICSITIAYFFSIAAACTLQ